MARDARIDGSKREKNSPRYEPDWQHDADHHAEETDIKIAVQSVDILDFTIIRLEDRYRPSEEARGEWLLSLSIREVSTGQCKTNAQAHDSKTDKLLGS
jgi:hypothetical protein